MSRSMHKQLHEIGSLLGLDCGDNSCLCASQKGGMRTNGGCQCDVASAVERLRAELSECRSQLQVFRDASEAAELRVVELRATIARVEALLMTQAFGRSRPEAVGEHATISAKALRAALRKP